MTELTKRIERALNVCTEFKTGKMKHAMNIGCKPLVGTENAEANIRLDMDYYSTDEAVF
eukprot:TRINITY_DN16083_c0_g1_i1.p2 TRINITY_DN16083_c0_g1~~TRINITY_DN16083_c0_g1_i1.p2  ORF type:complete len:59 (+),score=7.79 TRINITY_DN16083_c0_g1_i1:452-628(+)